MEGGLTTGGYPLPAATIPIDRFYSAVSYPTQCCHFITLPCEALFDTSRCQAVNEGCDQASAVPTISGYRTTPHPAARATDDCFWL
jgi:hypothetical protein